MDGSQLRARQQIEADFRKTVDRDVEVVAEEECRKRGMHALANACGRSDGVISDMIWSRFGAFDWDGVAYVYDGTYGHASRYLWAKVELTLAWVSARGHFTKDIEEKLDLAVTQLRLLWREWAGWKATTSDDLASALSESYD